MGQSGNVLFLVPWLKHEPAGCVLIPESQVHEDKAKVAKEAYNEKMEEYRSSPAFVAYSRTLNLVSGQKTKMVARAKVVL